MPQNNRCLSAALAPARLRIEADSSGHRLWSSAVRVQRFIDQHLAVARDLHASHTFQDRSPAAVPGNIFRMTRDGQPAVLAKPRGQGFIPNLEGLIDEGSNGTVGLRTYDQRDIGDNSQLSLRLEPNLR